MGYISSIGHNAFGITDEHGTHYVTRTGNSMYSEGKQMTSCNNTSFVEGTTITKIGNTYHAGGKTYTVTGNTLHGNGKTWNAVYMSDEAARAIIMQDIIRS